MLHSIAIAIAIATVPGTVRVVTTLPDFAALTREIGGEHVEVTALVAPTQDPHYVDAKPSLVVPLNRADLLIVNGLGLEVGWLPPLQVGARNGAIQVGGDGYLDVSTVVQRLQVPTGSISRAQGDIHPGGNPHFACDPRAAVNIVAAITDKLAGLDPGNAAHYRSNGKRLMEELRAVAGEVRARFDALPADKRRVVVYHDSLVYLNDWLGLEQIITVEPKPGIPPNPAHVAKVLSTMKANGVRVILQEQFYPRNTSETLAKLASGNLVVLDASTHFDREQRYVDHVREMAREVYDALAR